jgi:NitT/TauT family transport system substrate-binding protein
MHLTRKAALVLGGSFIAAPALARADVPALHVGMNTNEITAQAYYAQEAGIFKKNGVNVEIEKLPGGNAVASAIIGGSLQAGASNCMSFATSVLKGLPFIAIAPGAISDAAHPLSGIVVAADSPVRGAKDLTGKVISLNSIGSTDQLAAMAWLDGNGGDAKSVQFLEIPPAAVTQALAQNRIAASLMFEPFLSLGRAAGLRLIGDPYVAIAPRFLATLWIATPAWANDNKSTAHALAKSLVEGTQWSLSNTERAVALLSDWTSMKVDRLRQPMATTLDPAMLQPLLDVAVKYKLLAHPLAAADLIWKG